MLSRALGCMSDPEGGQDCRTMVLVCHTVKSQTCLAVLFLALSTASGRRVVSLGWCVLLCSMQYVPLEGHWIHFLPGSDLAYIYMLSGQRVRLFLVLQSANTLDTHKYRQFIWYVNTH